MASCKSCFNKKIHNSPVNDELIDKNDRTIIDLIKDNMAKEQLRNEEMFAILRDEIKFMKDEITHKNTLIESLLTELFELKRN